MARQLIRPQLPFAFFLPATMKIEFAPLNLYRKHPTRKMNTATFKVNNAEFTITEVASTEQSGKYVIHTTIDYYKFSNYADFKELPKSDFVTVKKFIKSVENKLKIETRDKTSFYLRFPETLFTESFDIFMCVERLDDKEIFKREITILTDKLTATTPELAKVKEELTVMKMNMNVLQESTKTPKMYLIVFKVGSFVFDLKSNYSKLFYHIRQNLSKYISNMTAEIEYEFKNCNSVDAISIKLETYLNSDQNRTSITILLETLLEVNKNIKVTYTGNYKNAWHWIKFIETDKPSELLFAAEMWHIKGSSFMVNYESIIDFMDNNYYFAWNKLN